MITLDDLTVFLAYPDKHLPQKEQKIVVGRVKQNGEELFRVVAKRNPTDSFNKYIGAKVAFAKILRRLNLSKERRTEFWNAFFNFYPQAR